MKTICQCEHITHFDDGAPERLAQRYMAHGYAAIGTVAVLAVPEISGGICQECIDHGHVYVETNQL